MKDDNIFIPYEGNERIYEGLMKVAAEIYERQNMIQTERFTDFDSYEDSEEYDDEIGA